MQTIIRSGRYTTLAALLSLLQLAQVRAHDDNGDRCSSSNESATTGHLYSDYPPTYFALTNHASLMYAHIVFMIISWVFALPVAVMLSLVSSRYTLTAQLTFLALNGIGVLLATIYNAHTPDLYPGNAHHTIGWIITLVAAAHVLVSLLKWLVTTVRPHKEATKDQGSEQHSLLHFSANFNTLENQHDLQNSYRSSYEYSQQTEGSGESERSDSISTHVGDEEDPFPSKEYEDGSDQQELGILMTRALTLEKKLQEYPRVLPKWSRIMIDMAYGSVDRVILLLGFVALATGIVTHGRFFEGSAIYGGLAHWIKGGVFFWLGIFNLGRWCGAFADRGWAWNIHPRKGLKSGVLSAEFFESALIFFYGSTNIFLEHLGRWNNGWTAQDLEHISITVLFIGGGLCGMLVESTCVRDLLNTTVADVKPRTAGMDAEDHGQSKAPESYHVSVNPIPSLVIMLLGMMMSSHHQQSMVSTMVHKQWGNLLMGASFARALTYLIIFIRPPESIFPSRPPTELLAAFGLIAGGVIFMASSNDTVEGMIHYKLEAMFVYTVTVGLVGILMAWEVTVLAIKGWALRKERRDNGFRSH